PLSSIAGRRFIFEAMMHGGITHFASDALPFSDVPRVRPTLIGMAPRVSTVLYQQFKSELLARLGTLPANLFDHPVSIGLLDEMRTTALGDRLCMIRLGSGDSAPDVLEFLDRCFRVHVANSYGQTETSSIMINGRVLPYVEYRLLDAPELGYSTSDRPPRGELVVRSVDLSSGYLDDAEATAALFEPDGFLRTGDIVEEREPGLLAWIDRRQAVVKLAQGFFVAPARLEILYVAGSSYIEQIYLYANPRRAFLLAVIVPNQKAQDHDDEHLRRLFRAELDRIARTEKLRSHDVPRDFIIERAAFSQANQLLLETGKQSPRRLREHYAARLDILGDAIEARQLGTGTATSDTPSTIQSKFAAVLGLPIAELAAAPDATFIGYGGDSVSALRLCALVEEAFHVAVPVGIVLDPSATIAMTVERIATLIASGRDTTYEQVHGTATVVFASELAKLVSDGTAAVVPARAPTSILLTGATGFLGRVLALDLERRLPEHGRLTCLVRGTDDRAARDRMRAAMTSVAPELAGWFDDATARGRLVIRAGDLQAPRFGLSDELQIDSIVHNGALVNHAMSYRDLFEPNVLGALEVVRMAAARPGITVNFISSIGVAARPGSTPVTEIDRAASLFPSRPIGGGADEHAVGYITSKWAGEVLLEKLHERHGVHVNVLRCSNIAPHREFSAHLNWADMTNRLLLGIVATGL
ncbi:MAG TPA: SDR family oxidoreductase, partial [Kofleriaceae bacterium]